MKAEQERLKRLLIEAVRVFINDSVKCHNAVCVEGLIGITLENEVFLVYVNESPESCAGMVGCTATNSDSLSGEAIEGVDVVSNDFNISWLVKELTPSTMKFDYRIMTYVMNYNIIDGFELANMQTWCKVKTNLILIFVLICFIIQQPK